LTFACSSKLALQLFIGCHGKENPFTMNYVDLLQILMADILFAFDYSST